MTGDDIRNIRAAMGLSQTALAEALGMTQRTITRWETGAVPISEPRAMWLRRELARVEREQNRKRKAS